MARTILDSLVLQINLKYAAVDIDPTPEICKKFAKRTAICEMVRTQNKCNVYSTTFLMNSEDLKYSGWLEEAVSVFGKSV